MNREDFIALIEATEAIIKIEQACKIMTGVGLDEGEAVKAYGIWEVIRRNSAEKYQTVADHEEDFERYHNFIAILQNEELTAEEKYEKLMG